MSVEILTAFMAFAFVTSVTPGPNNLMLMNSGASFGIRKTVPHVLGIVVGFIFMLLLVGLGIMQIFQRFPVSYDILKVSSIAYLLYLALRSPPLIPHWNTMPPRPSHLALYKRQCSNG